MSSIVLMILLVTVSTTENRFNVGESYSGTALKINEGRAFQEIQLTLHSQKYLFIDFSLTPPLPQVNLSIHLEDASQNVRNCTFAARDNCYVSPEQLGKATYITIGVDCKEQCKYQVHTYWQDILQLHAGEKKLIKFDGKRQKQLYRVNISQSPFLNVKIFVRPEIRQPFESVKIYGKYGRNSEPSSSNHDFVSNHLWEDCEGIFLSSNETGKPQFVLMVFGELHSTYTISLELVNKNYSDLTVGNSVDEYLLPRHKYVFHLKFKDESGVLNFNQYMYKLSTFRGRLLANFFYDEHLVRIYPHHSYQLMGDEEFLFTRDQIAKDLPNGLYVSIGSLSVTTYRISLQGIAKNQAIRMQEHVTQFVNCREKQGMVYFDYEMHNEGQQSIKDTVVTVHVTKLFGDSNITFKSCVEEKMTCKNDLSGPNAVGINPKSIKNIGRKVSYQFPVVNKPPVDANKRQQGEIIIHVSKSEKTPFCLVALEYLIENRLSFLRDNRLIEAISRPNQLKLYKYKNSDPLVEEVRIYINQISGKIKVHSQRKDPKDTKVMPTNKLETTSIISFKDNLLQPIVLTVLANEESIYSISVQAIRKEEKALTTFSLSEGVEFSVIIPPQKYEIFEIHPLPDKQGAHKNMDPKQKQDINNLEHQKQTSLALSSHRDIHFNYKATGPIEVCILNAKLQCHEEISNKALRQGQIDMLFTQTLTTLLKVENKGSKVVSLTAIYKSNVEPECRTRKMGEYYRDTIEQGECIRFQLPSLKDMEIMLAREEVGLLEYNFTVCKKQSKAVIKEFGEERYLFKKEDLETYCVDSPEHVLTLRAGRTKSLSAADAKRSLSLGYLLQYKDGHIQLTNGMAYHDKVQVNSEVVRVYRYQVLNPDNTTITLHSQQMVNFVLKIVQAQDEATTIINSIEYDMMAQREILFLLLDQMIIVTSDKLALCTQCVILIAVLSMENIGAYVQYTIQISQGVTLLQEARSRRGFLALGSIAYYDYRCPMTGSMFVSISDDNRRCTKIYLSEKEAPGASNNIVQELGNQLVYECATNKLRHISVEATGPCPYSITATTSLKKILRVERGVTQNIKLSAGEIQLFVMHQSTKMSFKLLSLHEYGQIEIYLNRSDAVTIEKLASTKQVDIKKFQMKGQMKNRLVMLTDNPLFCVDCYYLVAVEAIKHTESSLYYGDEETLVPFTKKVVNDYLSHKGEKVMGTYFGGNIVKMELKVHSGHLQVNVSRENNFFVKNFTVNAKLQVEHYEFIQELEISLFKKLFELLNWSSTRIQFLALADETVYSARFTEDEEIETVEVILDPVGSETEITIPEPTYPSSEKMKKPQPEKQKTKKPQHKKQKIKETFPNDIRLVAGEPSHIQVENKKQKCVKGYMWDHKQRILLTTDYGKSKELSELNLTATIGGNYVTIKKQTVRNILALEFSQQNHHFGKEPSKFRLCMNIKQDYAGEVMKKDDKKMALGPLLVTILQSEDFTLIGEDTETLVEGNLTFVLHTQSQFLLDIFQCKGQAKIAFSDTRMKMQEESLKTLDLLGIAGQPHALRVSKYGMTFVKVDVPLATVRWFPLKEKTGRGFGYVDYKAATLMYDMGFNEINIKWGSLIKNSPNKNTIKSIVYTIYIANSQSSLQSAMQCEQYVPNDIMVINHVLTKPQSLVLNTSFTHTITKDQLNTKYSSGSNLFISVMANMQIKTSTGDLEDYRFIYHEEELPSIHFQPHTIDSKTLFWLLLVIIASVLALLVCTYACSRKILPMLGILKNRVLIQEEMEDKNDRGHPGIELPGSSDRQGLEGLQQIVDTDAVLEVK